MLGNAEDEAALQKQTPDMLSLYRSYKETLKPYGIIQNGEKEIVSKEIIIDDLRAISEAIDMFDLDKADDIMKRLDTYQIEEVLEPFMENLRAFVADVAMEDIMNTAEQMVKMIEEN